MGDGLLSQVPKDVIDTVAEVQECGGERMDNRQIAELSRQIFVLGKHDDAEPPSPNEWIPYFT
jgi:hypothetical protein